MMRVMSSGGRFVRGWHDCFLIFLDDDGLPSCFRFIFSSVHWNSRSTLIAELGRREMK